MGFIDTAIGHCQMFVAVSVTDIRNVCIFDLVTYCSELFSKASVTRAGGGIAPMAVRMAYFNSATVFGALWRAIFLSAWLIARQGSIQGPKTPMVSDG